MWKALMLFSLVCFVSCSGEIDVGLSDKGTSSNGSTGGTSNSGGIGYQLDMDASELALMGIPTRLTMSNNYQTGTHTLSGADGEYVAYPSNFINFILNPVPPPPVYANFSSGIKAIEFELHLPERLVAGGFYGVAGTVLLGDGSDVVISVLARANADGTYSIEANNQNGDILDLTVSYSSLPTRIGVEFNATNSTMKLFFDGVEQGLSDNSYIPQNTVLGLVARETNILSGNYGLNCIASLITTAGDMTTSFSSGTTDIFGTLIPQDS